MTRTSHATAVFALFFCLAAPVWAGDGSTPPSKPAVGDPKLDTTFKLLVYPGDDPKTTGMSDVQQQKVKKAFQAYNDALTDAQAKAQQTVNTASARQDTVRKDPRLAEALAKVGGVLNDPAVSPRVREQGSAAFNAGGRPKDAAALSEQTLKAEPDNRDALNNLSQARYSLGQYQDAIANATRLMKLDPDNESAYTTRALSNYYSGHYLEAREDAQRALALNKENEVALATLRMANSRVKQAELKLGPGATEQANRIRAEYQAMLEQQNQQEAETARTQGSRAPARIQTPAPAPESADAASSPGQAALQRAAASNQAGEYEEAVADATEALRLSPGSALALDARSRALLNLGRVEDAARDATDAIRLDPANAYPFATRARAREKMKDWAGMLADFQQAARLNPQFEPDYRRALERHALPPAPTAATPVPARGDESGASRVWLLILSSVVGGSLIAAGLVHVFSVQWNRKVTTAIRRLEEARGAATLNGHDLGGLGSHFQVVRAIGKGGMGIVYEAMDKALNRRVALKKMREEISGDTRERERFLHEARTVAGLHHPNIVDIHSIVEDGGALGLVFEYVPGRTVEQMIAEKKRLSVPEVRHIMRGVCQALEYAHKRGVIHRDLKPSNIMLTDEYEVKVMDFGIARQAKDALNRANVTNTIAGTPPYMAPEADKGVIRKETDVYGLGACLYEMLTGERPFPAPATTSSKLAMDFVRPTGLRKDLPAGIDALVDASLAPDPEKRIHTPAEFMARLDAAISVPAS